MMTGFAKQKLEMICHIPGSQIVYQVSFHEASIGTYRPATSTLRIACGIENPSKTGTACVTPSPESRTIPVVLPDEYLNWQ